MGEEIWDEEKAVRMLGSQNSIALRIETGLKGAEKPFNALILTNSNSYSATKKYIMKKFGGEKIIFVTLNEGYSKLKKIMPQEIWKNVFVIDMISAETNLETTQAENAEYLDSPSDLMELVLQTEKKIPEIQGNDVMVIIDSLSTMLVYNETGAVKKLMHTLLAKIAAHNASAIVLSSDLKEKSDITKTIGQFFWKIIKT